MRVYTQMLHDKQVNTTPVLIVSQSNDFFFSHFFVQEDMETSKYVCRMCLARLKFYKINKSSL